MKKLLPIALLILLLLLAAFLLRPELQPADDVAVFAEDKSTIELNFTDEAPAWTCDRNSSSLSGQVDYIGSKLQPMWEVKLGGGIYSSGIMHEGKLYLADENGGLSCLNLADGKIIWVQPLPQPVFSPLLMHEEVLYFGDTHGSFHAFDTATRKILWSYSGSKEKISGGATLSPDGQLLIYGSYDFKLRALKRATGELVFELKTRNYINGTPAIAGGKVLFGGCDSHLRMLNIADGTEEMKVDLGSYIPCSIATDEQHSYATCYDGTVKAVNWDGKISWQYRPEDAAYQCSPSVNSKYLVSAEQNGVINIFDKATGKRSGSVTIAGDIARAPLLDEQRAIVADEDGNIHIIALETAQIISTYAYGTVISAPLLLNGGILIICDEDGQVSCFQMEP